MKGCFSTSTVEMRGIDIFPLGEYLTILFVLSGNRKSEFIINKTLVNMR